jgi:hypothetical protein
MHRKAGSMVKLNIEAIENEINNIKKNLDAFQPKKKKKQVN